MNWQESQILDARNQRKQFSETVKPDRLRRGRIFRAGRTSPSPTLAFWDVILLGQAYEDVNMNDAAQINATGRAVYGYISDCRAPSTMSLYAGDKVSIWLPNLTTRIVEIKGCEVLSGSYDVAQLGTNGEIIAGGGGAGGCDGCFQAQDVSFAFLTD